MNHDKIIGGYLVSLLKELSPELSFSQSHSWIVIVATEFDTIDVCWDYGNGWRLCNGDQPLVLEDEKALKKQLANAAKDLPMRSNE